MSVLEVEGSGPLPSTVSPTFDVALNPGSYTWGLQAVDGPGSVNSSSTLNLVIVPSGSPGYTLSVGATNGSVSLAPDQQTYPEGSDVTLTASPDSGYLFDSWSGDATGSNNPITVTMDANKNITANFVVDSQPPPPPTPTESQLPPPPPTDTPVPTATWTFTPVPVASNTPIPTSTNGPPSENDPTLNLHLAMENNVIDLSGQGNHGTWKGAPEYGSGMDGSGIHLDGTTSAGYIEIPNNQPLDGWDAVTVCVWAKKDNAGVGGPLVLKHASYRLVLTSDSLEAYLFDSNAERYDLEVDGTALDSEWHHYALTYDGNVLKLFVDGNPAASRSNTGTVSMASVPQ